jgi:hypothetical protein
MFGIATLTVTLSAQEFRCTFESDPGGGQNFCFAGKVTPTIPSGRTITWERTSGWKGTGAAKITVHGCTTASGCSTALNQGNVGWFTNPIGGTYPLGSRKFIRYRLKLASKMGNIGAAKFNLFGSDDYRTIPKLGLPFNTNAGCHPSSEGNDYYGVFLPDTDPANAYLRAEDFGLGLDTVPTRGFSELATGSGTTLQSNYAMWSPGIGISFNCAPFILLPYVGPGGVADIKPQNNAAPSQDGWVHIQVEVISGAQGQAGFKVWANNNNYNSPTTQALNMNQPGAAMLTTAWEGSYHIGGYWGMASSNPVAFLIDDVEISNTFSTTFYELAGSSPSTPAPTPPTLIRVS